MRNLFLIAIAIATIGGATTNKAHACNLRLPTFEVTGFPISPHQVAVLGAAHVEERSAMPKLKLAGMPASPHQIAVLTARKPVKIIEAAAEINPSWVAREASIWPTSKTYAAGPICVAD
jgi:hypothetical protein